MAGVASFLTEAYGRHFGRSADVRLYRGPGRVNLIGEHTDYNLGFVLPMALEMACFTAAAPNDSGALRVYSVELKQAREWAVDHIASLQPAHDWGDYVAGVAQQLVRAGFPISPANLLIHSTVPVGSGLSSSAALETSTALALLGGRKIDKLELVKLCRRAENEFVGMPCGIMDQYISVFGREHAAVRIDCRSLAHDVVRLPDGGAILAVNTMVKHELGQSAYRDRVRECAEAAAAIRAVHPKVESLRDVTVEMFQAVEDRIPAVPRKRARHVVTEDDRVERFMQASARGDLKRMGELFVASHRSLQLDYDVSCEELDFLVDTALTVPGVYGARLTGGGFGGCTVNLIDPEAVNDFKQRVAGAYEARFHIKPQMYECRAADGAGAMR